MYFFQNVNFFTTFSSLNDTLLFYKYWLWGELLTLWVIVHISHLISVRTHLDAAARTALKATLAVLLSNICVSRSGLRRLTVSSQRENTAEVAVKIKFLFAPPPTPLPILNICYKLDMYNMIQCPSQNASGSLQINLFTLYKTLHT